MKKIALNDPETRSADLVGENIEQLKALFPEAVTEGRIDLDVLKQLLGGAVEESEEKYGLSWHGKRRARQMALIPSTGTLRPCPEDSVDWDTTQNLMIEGDNLEVLKLLQRSYAGKVQIIYIDPPYNTGKDFIYPDNYRDNIRNYLELTGQADGERRKLSSNTEASGRFHTAWLNMMYPRLKLARNLLRQDGVLFVSIDDAEVANARTTCDEIFGGDNFIAEIVWEGANKNDARQIGICHEYVLVYGRHRAQLVGDWGLQKKGIESVLKEVKRLRRLHGDNFRAASTDLRGWFLSMKSKPAFNLRRFHNIDANGAYKEDDPTAAGGRRFDLRNPHTGQIIPLRPGRGWGFDQESFEELVAAGRITFVTDTSVMVRRYLHETQSVTPPSVYYQPARSASERLSRLMTAKVFDFPKDEILLESFIEMVTTSCEDRQAIVMDFFAGSGSIAESVMRRNAKVRGHLRYVLVQLPEVLRPERKGHKTAVDFCDALGKPRNIAELTKERLRRAGAKVQGENPDFTGDLGFRVFKLDTSNIRTWNPDADDLEGSLLGSLEHIKPDRTGDDIFWEVLLKLGHDLSAPIETRTMAGTTVRSVGAGTLIACLGRRIDKEIVEPLALGIAAWHGELAPAGETTVVFRDSAFADDVAKTNLTAILDQHGLGNVRSL
ncbi:MAG: site-specific DNA-methyltransferase [Gemmatimonadota bacterium]|nr:site-specific DNA-methyltransferase [Gemmatimonadota bacterium]